MLFHPNNARLRILNGRVEPSEGETRRKYAAIVGFGPTAIQVRAIQEDPDWEIWGLNDGYKNPCFYDGAPVYGTRYDTDAEGIDGIPMVKRRRTIDLDAQSVRLRVDRWFELHPMRVQPPDDVAWLARCPVPVYLLRDVQSGTARHYPESPAYAPETVPELPMAVTYPVAAIEAMLTMPAPFWASTFAYQMALAVAEGFEGIGLFGLDFGSEREWMFERPNALWWAGYASGRGLKLLIPPQSTFLEHRFRYGYEYDEEVAWCQARIRWFHEGWGLSSVERMVST